jgi:hypothetical protein
VYFDIYGPFKIEKQSHGKLIDNTNDAKKHFWDKVEKYTKSLKNACGCYIFCIRAAKGFKPIYVGLAQKQTFEKECFTPSKINIYNEAVAAGKGTPILFLITKLTNKGNKFAKPSKNGHSDIKTLETLLIGTALEKNPALMNIKKTKHWKEMVVPGLLNPPQGPPSKDTKAFKKAMFRN